MLERALGNFDDSSFRRQAQRQLLSSTSYDITEQPSSTFMLIIQKLIIQMHAIKSHPMVIMWLNQFTAHSSHGTAEILAIW